MDRNQVTSKHANHTTTVTRIANNKPSDANIFRIFSALCDNPYGLSVHELIRDVYADDPDGGPLSAESSIRATVFRFNKCAKKQKLGLRISGKTGSGAGYRYRIFIVRT